MKTVVTLAVAMALCAGVVFAGAGSKVKVKYEQPFIETGSVREIPSRPMPHDGWSMLNPLAGTFTTLTGWYDYQSNGGAIQQIRVNPANGNIHVTWMTAFDSTEATLNNSRRVAYAYSTNNGSKRTGGKQCERILRWAKGGYCECNGDSYNRRKNNYCN